MVGHAIYLKHLMFILLKNTGYILVQSFLPISAYKGTPVFNRKNKLDMNLSITISHIIIICRVSTTNRSYGTKIKKTIFLPTKCSAGTNLQHLYNKWHFK